MKGDMSIEMLAMVVVAVLIISVVYLWFSGEAEIEQASDSGFKSAICKTNLDCINSNEAQGKVCMRSGTPLASIFCGCWDSSDCKSGQCGDDNKCY